MGEALEMTTAAERDLRAHLSVQPQNVLWVKFAAWHMDNPAVWKLFVRFAFEAIRAKRVRFSARTIIHRIRWYTAIETASDDGFKINDHQSAYYARVFLEVYPAHETLFELREVSDDAPTRRLLVRVMWEALT